jgi:prevent-host-death family protein
MYHHRMTSERPDPVEVSVAELRRTLAGTLNQVATRGQIVYVTSHGRRVASIVPVPLAERIGRGDG